MGWCRELVFPPVTDWTRACALACLRIILEIQRRFYGVEKKLTNGTDNLSPTLFFFYNSHSDNKIAITQPTIQNSFEYIQTLDTRMSQVFTGY